MAKRLRFFEKDTVNWNAPSVAPFYHGILELKHRNPALFNGAYGGTQVKLATTGSDKVYAFTRTRANNTVLVAVNFGDQPSDVRFTGLEHPGAYTDWFTHGGVSLSPSGHFDVPAHGYRVLVK